MALEWTFTAGIGLIIGISIGTLIELKYVLNLDRKMEHLIERMLKLEERIEKEVLGKTKAKKRK